MKELHIEPPPLPKGVCDRSTPEPLQEEKRANQLMLVGALSIVIMFILLLSMFFWFSAKPKGNGATTSQDSQGNDVSVMGTALESRPNGAKSSSQLTGDIKDIDDASRDSGHRFAASGKVGQNQPASPAEGSDSGPIKESMIPIPSGKVSGDAMAIALGDAFNPFLESANGNEIVYVIDVSGSMSGGRYARVAEELIEAIYGLKERQRFNIILFSTNATVFRQEGMVTSTQDVKRAAAEWLKLQSCGGGTDPSSAIEIAVQMAPEKIMVLSDGEFDSVIPTYVTSLNNSLGATIDCIGFDPQSLTLKEIAAQNGPGRFYAVR